MGKLDIGIFAFFFTFKCRNQIFSTSLALLTFSMFLHFSILGGSAKVVLYLCVGRPKAPGARIAWMGSLVP